MSYPHGHLETTPSHNPAPSPSRDKHPQQVPRKTNKTKPPERAHSVPRRGSDHPFQREERVGCDRQTHMISANVHPQPPNNALHPSAAQISVRGQQKKQISSLTTTALPDPSVPPLQLPPSPTLIPRGLLRGTRVRR